MMYYTWGVMLLATSHPGGGTTSSSKSARTVRKYEKHSAETLMWVSFRMSFRLGRRQSGMCLGMLT